MAEAAPTEDAGVGGMTVAAGIPFTKEGINLIEK
jgi:hypothetical protein